MRVLHSATYGIILFAITILKAPGALAQCESNFLCSGYSYWKSGKNCEQLEDFDTRSSCQIFRAFSWEYFGEQRDANLMLMDSMKTLSVNSTRSPSDICHRFFFESSTKFALCSGLAFGLTKTDCNIIFSSSKVTTLALDNIDPGSRGIAFHACRNMALALTNSDCQESFDKIKPEIDLMFFKNLDYSFWISREYTHQFMEDYSASLCEGLTDIQNI